MKNFTLLFIITALILTTYSCRSEAGNEMVVIVQVTDPQMGFVTSNKGNDYEISNLTIAVDKINELQPDAVVFTGDLVNNPLDEEQWNDFNRIVSLLGSKIDKYYIPGNHDVVIRDGFADATSFVERFGSDRFSNKIGNLLITGYNSTLLKEHKTDDGQERKQFEWLDAALANKKDNEISIVFVHHPFFFVTIDDKDSYSVIAPEKRAEYFELFEKRGVSAVFAGHLHDGRQAIHNGIDMVTASAVGGQLGKSQPGITVITLYKNDLRYNYYPLEDIPANRSELTPLYEHNKDL